MALALQIPVPMDQGANRSINWLETASQCIAARFPSLRNGAEHITERLSALLLERMSVETCHRILDLLPQSEQEIRTLRSLEASSACDADPSIGYTDFIERAAHTIGCASLGLGEDLGALAREVSDAFLWSFAQEFPAEIKIRLFESLPLDLRSRMNLHSASAEESKVA